MAIYAGNSFESGQADGTAITTGNSGGAAGRAWDVVDGTATYDAASAAHGALGGLLDQGSNGRCQLQWIDGADTAAACYLRAYIRAATPTSNMRFIHVNGSGGTQAFALQWRTSGVLRLLDSVSANMAESTLTLPANQLVRVEVKVTPSTTAGQAEVRVYTDPESTTPAETITTAASFNTLAAVGMWRFGPTAGAANYTMSMDDAAVSFDDWIGPAAVPSVTGDMTTAAAADLAMTGQKSAHGQLELTAAAALTATGERRTATLGVDADATLAADGHKAATGTGGLAGIAMTQISGRKVVHGSLAVDATAELQGDGGVPGEGATLDLTAQTGVTFHGQKPKPPPTPPPPLPVPAIDWKRRGRLYRYVFADFLTDSTLAVLDLEDVTFDRRICQPGSFKATVPVPNAEVAAAVQRIVPRDDTTIATGPGRTVVHVYRGEVIWGTYLIWTATVKSDERGRITVDLQGASLESYLDHREIREDIQLIQADQLDIARYLVAHMQTQGDDSSVGIEVGGQPVSGLLRDRTYLASEAATYGQRLTELAQVIDGPEWMIRTWQDPDTGRRRREFIVGDRMGDEDTRHIFTQPGNIVAWSYPADATSAATSWQTRGDTIQDDVAEDSQPLLSGIWENPAYREAGWPLLEQTVDYQSITRVETLNDYAKWWAANRSGMIRIPQVQVRLPRDTDWNPNNLGDSAQLKLINEWFPRGTFDRRWRVIGCEITPPTRDDGIEKMTLIFAEPSDEAASERVNGGPPVAPGVPAGLHVVETTESSVSLAWDTTPTADFYHLFQNGGLVDSPTMTSTLVDGLQASTTYSFTISAVNLGGESAQSSAVPATTSAPQT